MAERWLVQAVVGLVGQQFTLDGAACNAHNAHAPKFCTPTKSFLATNVEGEHVWLNPPFKTQIVSDFLQHYNECKARAPLTTSACVLLPDWEWIPPLVSGYRKLLTIPAGNKVFNRPQLGGGRQRLGPMPWGVTVYWDPPRESAQVRVVGQDEHVTHMRFPVEVGGRCVAALLDTGASVSVVSIDLARRLSCELHTAHMTLTAANGDELRVHGVVQLDVTFPGVGTYAASCFACDVSEDLILGEDWCAAHAVTLVFPGPVLRLAGVSVSPRGGVPDTVYTKLESADEFVDTLATADVCYAVMPGAAVGEAGLRSVHPEVQQVLDEYSDVFKDELTGLPPMRDVAHTIPLEPGSVPPKDNPRRASPKEREEMMRQVQAFLQAGIIRPSASPFASPVLFVSKPDGSLRMCIDYRRLNNITRKNGYPLPRIDDLLDRLSKARFFTSLDLVSGYHQIRIHEEDVEKTAFTTPFGLYEFLVLPFGLTNAPATFQGAMNSMFSAYHEYVLVYLDDVLVYSATMGDHVRHLRQVLHTLRENQFYAKPAKCKFAQTEIKYLGHVIGGGGLKPDPAKVDTVRNWPVLTTKEEVRSFLGLAGYFRRFVPHYATVAWPITRMLRQDVPFEWTADCQRAFDELKRILTSQPLLKIPDPEGSEFTVVCDASGHGVGAVLLQDGQPCAYVSRQFKPAETRYATGDQELLAVVHAVNEFRPYIEGVHFTLQTDHKPLTFLNTQAHLSRRVVRWQQMLAAYNFAWQHIAGKTNVADPLSRRPARVLAVYALTRRQQRGTLADRASTSSAQSPPVQRQKQKRPRDAPVPPTRLLPLETPLEPVDAMLSPFLTEVCTRQQDDPYLQAVDKDEQRGWVFRDGLWYHKAKLYVPEGLREDCLHECHDSEFAGHRGVLKTEDLVRRHYWWPSLSKDVQAYVKGCDPCQRNKSRQTKPGGLLQPLEIPAESWYMVTMDFITNLPPTDAGNDAILVVVDKLTKFVVLVECALTSTSQQVISMLQQRVFCYFGWPKVIVSDRDPRFASDVFSEWAQSRGIALRMSTAYHPQTDGQTERMNRVVEEVLRCYVGTEQRDWDAHLHAVQFANNNSVHVGSRNTPAFLNFGLHPRRPFQPDAPLSVVPLRTAFWDQVTRAKSLLQAAADKMKRAADVRRRPASFVVGEKVLLSSKNFRFVGQSCKKLMPRYIGPFTVAARVGHAAYRLDLPPIMRRCHPVFHVSLLQPYVDTGRYQPPPPLELDGDWYYEVANIVGHRGRGRAREYLIQWSGYDLSHNTWEPVRALVADGLETHIAQYERDAQIPSWRTN